VLLPENEWGNQIMVSAIDGHHSIFIRSLDIHNKSLIKIWHPYAVVDENDPDTTASLTTILEHPSHTVYSVDNDFALSRDKSMIAICAYGESKGRAMLYFIDNNNNSASERKLTLKQSFSARAHCSSIQFTPDGKYLSYVNENGLLVFWNIITESDITDQINISYSNRNEVYLSAVNFSPACSGRRFLVRDQDLEGFPGCYCIASFWESSEVQNNRKQQKRPKCK
jgi:WD40 repeat protein